VQKHHHNWDEFLHPTGFCTLQIAIWLPVGSKNLIYPGKSAGWVFCTIQVLKYNYEMPEAQELARSTMA
jgi:hypothetical protein